MRLTPDQGLHAVMADRLKTNQALKMSQASGKAYAGALKKMGVDEATIAEAMQDPTGEALKLLYQSVLVASRQKPEASPSSQREYEFALTQGYQGSYTDFLDKKKQGTTINMPPSIPAGYVAEYDDSGRFAGMKPATGGPVERELLEKEQKKKTSFEMYETGINGLSQSLAGTATGSIAGLFPAITTNQQTSDAAIAAMAPIMKAMFREAGEGNFTDQDQQALLAMLPDRSFTPEARTYQLKLIDSIIRTKLGMPIVDYKDNSQGNNNPPPVPAGAVKILSVTPIGK